MKFNTKVIHAGIEPDPSTGAIMTPIFQTSTFVQTAPGEHKGFEYARTQNPTRITLEKQLALLEGGKHGLCFGSGMAATDAIMKLLNPGDEVVVSNDLYGGTFRLFTKVYENYGIRFHFVNMTDLDLVKSTISDKTKMVWIETPTNPMLNVVDIAAVAGMVDQSKVTVVVDNTFASPYLQQPMELGADIVVHSATKYLGGHSDVVHGAVICKHDSDAEKLYFIQNSAGAVPGPQDCFLILRGIKTLHLRMARACENAEAIANFLRGNDKVSKVYWPGFGDHPNHDVAKKQMKAFGGMVSFSLKEDSMDAATRVLSGTHLFSLAESLGGVESLIGHPATMTHAAIPIEERRKTGVVDSLIRLSVGVEDADDLIEDLSKALS